MKQFVFFFFKKGKYSRGVEKYSLSTCKDLALDKKCDVQEYTLNLSNDFVSKKLISTQSHYIKVFNESSSETFIKNEEKKTSTSKRTPEQIYYFENCKPSYDEWIQAGIALEYGKNEDDFCWDDYAWFRGDCDYTR